MIDNRIIGGVAAVIIVAVIASIVVVVLSVEDQDLPHVDVSTEKIKVFAAFFPYYEFAKNVAGDKAIVEQFIPTGVPAHDWEPQPGKIRLLQDGDVFVYNSLGIEPYMRNIIDSNEFEHIVFIKASENIDLLEFNENGEEFEDEIMNIIEEFERMDISSTETVEFIEDVLDEQKSDAHGHDGEMQEEIKEILRTMENNDMDVKAGLKEIGEIISKKEEGKHGYDPHIWLDPVIVKQQVNNIRDGLILADPENEEDYQRNAATYNAKLDEFDKSVRVRLSDCQLDTFVPFHNAFAYFAQQYSLKMFALGGLSPDAEATAMEIIEFVNFVKENNIKVVFAEDLIDPRLAEVIADEAGAQVMILSTIEALTPQEVSENTTYLEKMEQNIKALEKALECS